MTAGKYKNNLFVKSLCTFLILLLIPTVLFLVTSAVLCVKMERENLQRVCSSVNSRENIINMRIDGLTSLGAQISASKEIRQLEKADTPMNRWLFSSYLRSLALDNNFIQRIVVYQQEHNRIYTINANYFLEDFFSYGLSSEQPYQQQIDEMLRNDGFYQVYSAENLMIEGIPYNGIIFAMAYPTERETKLQKGKILMFIPKENLDALFGDIGLYGGFIWMTDADGQYLYHYGTENSSRLIEKMEQALAQGKNTVWLDGRQYYLNAAHKEGNFKLYAAVPSGSFISGGFLAGIIVFLLLSLLVSILLAVLITRKQTRPLEKIADIVETGGHPKEKLDYQVISANIKLLLQNYNQVAEREREQQEVLEYVFVEKLLNEQWDREQVSNHPLASRWSKEYKQFGVFMIHVISLEEDCETSESLTQAVLVGFRQENICYAYEWEKSTLLFLLGFSEPEEQICCKKVKRLADEITGWIQERYAVQTVTAACGFSNTVFDTAAMAKQAGRLLEENLKHPAKTQFWVVENAGGERLGYGLEEEKRLFNMTVNGNIADTKQMLDRLAEEERERLNTLCKSLGITLLRITAARELPDFWEQMINDALTASVEETERFRQIKDIFMDICRSVSQEKQKIQKEIIAEIKEYIQKNYTNNNLSLAMIAERFDSTIKHLSYLYKKYTGNTLSGDIEELRIAKACKLLTETELTVAEICEQSGFWSETTFRRTFKKLKGKSPAEYRKND